MRAAPGRPRGRLIAAAALPPAAPPPPPPPAATAPAPLRSLVDASTTVLRAVAAPPPADAPYARPDDGAGADSLADVAAAVERDFKNLYFTTGNISGRVYARGCVFADPTVSFAGLAEWRKNIGVLAPWLAGASIDLESLSTDARSSTITAAWRLRAPIDRLPWRPLVDVRGVTTYTVSPVQGRLVVTRHEEAWRTAPAAAVAQLLRPG